VSQRLAPSALFVVLTGCVSGGDGPLGLGPGPCGGWSSLDAEGTTWEYAYTGDAQGSFTNTALGERPWEGEDAFALETHGELQRADYESTWVSVGYFRCDAEGIWHLGYETSSSMVAGGNVTEITSRAVYTSPDLTHPLSLELGDTWVSDIAIELTTNGEVTPQEYTLEREVVEEAELEVAAGVFDAVAIEGRNTTRDYTFTQWYAQDVGFLMSEGSELVSWE